jgi:phosphoserine phosphatase
VQATLFDLDRTLVRKDTATLFVQYQRDTGEVRWPSQWRVAWWMLQYTFGLIDAPRVAARALRDFAGRAEPEFREACRECFRHYVARHLCPAGRATVAQCRDRGELVLIVTGATRFAAELVAEELGIEEIVCTELASWLAPWPTGAANGCSPSKLPSVWALLSAKRVSSPIASRTCLCSKP